MAFQEGARSGHTPDSSQSLRRLDQQPQRPAPTWDEILDLVDDDRPLTEQEVREARKDTLAHWALRLGLVGGVLGSLYLAAQQVANVPR